MEEYKYTDADLDKFMSVATQLIDEAGKLISAAIGKQNKAVDLKDANCAEGNASAVLTETDTAVEKHLVSGLKAAFPDHKFIGEEDISASETGMVEEYSNNPTWIIDPIDGTMNFVHRNPLCCTSMGLAINRRVVLGLVNNPMTGHLYTAIKGRGAFLNGEQRLSTSGVKTLKEAMILFELSAGAIEEKRRVSEENVSVLMKKAHAIRCPGPAALDMSWVGAGSADAFFSFGIHCWDMAAGALFITEGGGCVLSPSGKEFDLMGCGCIVAATESLAREVAETISVYRSGKRDFAEVCPM